MTLVGLRSHFGSSDFGSSYFCLGSSLFDPKPRFESSWASQLAIGVMKCFACMLCATCVEYCAKASDPEGTCLSKAQVDFFNTEFNKNDGDNSVASYSFFLISSAERKLSHHQKIPRARQLQNVELPLSQGLAPQGGALS